jgi:O-methyltransferase involved in polyketide biosynthesis
MKVVSGEVLDGLSATALWTLRNRGAEARRTDGLIRDPRAVTLLDSIDYDFSKFGKPSQIHALRARAFDAAMLAYLTAHPRASVVALAEGLQTSFWRIDHAGAANELTWYCVDLAPVVAIRQRLLPRDARIVELAQSALNPGWMGLVEDAATRGATTDTGDGVFITAEGLLMYLNASEALELIAACAARFPGGQMIFDSIPHWFSRRSQRGIKLSDRYVVPPMPFALTADEALDLAGRVPGVSAAHDIAPPPGRGLSKLLTWPVLDRLPLLRRVRWSITLLEFSR